MNLVSVIVPCFNHSTTVLQTLSSIRNQTYTNWECIIINDGSTDNSLSVIEEFTKSDSRFKVFSTENAGVSVARNFGVAQSSGRYIFPLDADNYIHEQYLQKCLNEFNRNSSLKLVYTEAEMFGEESGNWNLPAFDYATMLKFNMVDNSSVFLREDFDRVGGYRTNMVRGLEDWDFFIALLYGCSNDQVVKIKEPLYYYRVVKTGRRLTAAGSSWQDEMQDLIIYNNFTIYQQYFPKIFNRVMEYDFDKTMLNKGPVKWLAKTMIGLSGWKKKLKG